LGPGNRVQPRRSAMPRERAASASERGRCRGSSEFMVQSSEPQHDATAGRCRSRLKAWDSPAQGNALGSGPPTPSGAVRLREAMPLRPEARRADTLSRRIFPCGRGGAGVSVVVDGVRQVGQFGHGKRHRGHGRTGPMARTSMASPYNKVHK